MYSLYVTCCTGTGNYIIALNSKQLFLLLSFRVAATKVKDGMTVVVPRSHTDTDSLGSTGPN